MLFWEHFWYLMEGSPNLSWGMAKVDESSCPLVEQIGQRMGLFRYLDFCEQSMEWRRGGDSNPRYGLTRTTV
jgi:hypothetical protein